MKENRQELNRNLAQMLKGGVIMDVTTPEQARIAEIREPIVKVVIPPIFAQLVAFRA